ncbi:hypothetical protein [Bdellovibrio sp. HCB337]|uniref:hypothetical protein n=1 Tax=Bdellovibrio sp. HCB337 TaxID=3394358 RepID=UPI0039A6B8F4
MDMGTIIIIGGIAIGVLSIIIYALIAIFYPEWVGITGKVARSAEKSHEEGSPETKNNFGDKL